MKEVKKWMVYTKVVEVTITVPDDWTEEDGEKNVSDITSVALVGPGNWSTTPYILDTKEEANRVQEVLEEGERV